MIALFFIFVCFYFPTRLAFRYRLVFLSGLWSPLLLFLIVQLLSTFLQQQSSRLYISQSKTYAAINVCI